MIELRMFFFIETVFIYRPMYLGNIIERRTMRILEDPSCTKRRLCIHECPRYTSVKSTQTSAGGFKEIFSGREAFE